MKRDSRPVEDESGESTGNGGEDPRAREDAFETTGVEDESSDGPAFDEGRYVYCVVRTESDGAFETTGVEDEPVRVVAVDGIAAVVHECEDVYDSADLGEIRRWLVRHQAVVDEAAEAFGTPLPFQFDTIIRGDDDTVREWLRSEHDDLANALSALAGHWEYRIEVVRTEPVDDETLAAEDERLAELDEEIDAADSGTAYLLEKRYEDRLSELRARRRERLTSDVLERVDARVREVHELEESPARSIVTDAARDDGGDPVCRLTALAHEDDEDALGAELDEIAAEPGIEVRFTGPWPPYTFTPAFGDDDGRTDAGQTDENHDSGRANGG